MRTCTIIKRVLRGIRFSIALKEESYAFLVWSVRVESRHNHDLPWQIPHEAGRAEDWLTQPVEAFNCKLKCCFWSPTCICNTHTHTIVWNTSCSSLQDDQHHATWACFMWWDIGSNKNIPIPVNYLITDVSIFSFWKTPQLHAANRALQDVFLLYTISLNVSLAVGFVTTPVSSKAADAARQRHQMPYN